MQAALDQRQDWLLKADTQAASLLAMAGTFLTLERSCQPGNSGATAVAFQDAGRLMQLAVQCVDNACSARSKVRHCSNS